MKITFRNASAADCPRIAELDRIASGGVLEFLYRGLVPGKTPVELAAGVLSRESDSYSYASAILAEAGGEIAGMMISYHSSHHALSDDMTGYFPADRIDRLRVLFTAEVPESLYVDSLAVHDRYRRRGIGGALLDLAAEKARRQGLDTLSLVTFADNRNAHRLYRRHGFEVTARLPFEPDELVPHSGILVMAAPVAAGSSSFMYHGRTGVPGEPGT